MNDLNPTTLADAGMKMASSLGLSWPGDRAEIVLAVNMAREEIYNRYKEFKLFDVVERCFCLQCFKTPCRDGVCGSNTWLGFTLPADMVSISSAWQNNTPMKLNSRWRESVVGLDPKPACEIQLVQQGGTFATEKDFHNISKLTFVTQDYRDAGKAVYVDGFNEKWDRVCSEVILGVDAVETTEFYNEISTINFKDQRYAPVTLYVGEEEISRYAASETVPSYTRYKVGAPCCISSQVLVHGVKRFMDVWFDDEIVEIGSRLFLDSMGRWYRYRSSRDKTEIAIGAIGLTEALRHIDGIIARHRGSSREDNLLTKSFYTRQTRAAKMLSGYSRRR